MQRLSISVVRFCHLTSAVLGAIALSFLPSSNDALGTAPRPNILIILADDLGYGDVNLELPGQGKGFRHPVIKTPHLAALAAESVVFRHHYAAAPVCSPSRAGLLTGRTPTRCNIGLYISDLRDNGKKFLAGPEVTIAEIAKQAGYETAIFGKWHLNGADWDQPENWSGWTGSFPRQQGFDAGWVWKENPHFTRSLQVNTQRHPGDTFTVEGQSLGIVKGYTSDLITDSAINWLEEHRGTENPFLMYLPYDAVHIRISSPDRFENMYDTGDPRKDVYFANVTHLDDAIGRVLAALERLELEDNTLVYFSSDNGPDVLDKWHGTAFCMGTSYPLRGHKYQLDEGGIRVPGMIRWPSKLSPRISDEPNFTLDLLPTICELVGAEVPSDRAIDGVSVLSHLTETKPINREKPLYWQFEHPAHFESTGSGFEQRQNGNRKLRGPHASVAIRHGNYVLRGLQTGEYEPPTDFELYDVVADPETRHDLAAEKPDILAELKQQLLALHADVGQDREQTLQFIQSKGHTGK